MLAFACAFTMFAGAASYSDKADIKATTAVDMLSSLGVIQGYEDGSFKPNTTVTRAQMAKMIFTIMNGGNDNANAYTSLPTKFTDLPTAAWAQGYVRYLQNTGIIAGKSATKFAPNDTVTGLEAAKMVLVAAGYKADKAGLTGAAWAQNTMKYGQLNNLFEDVDADLNAALPRQYAAQILYNALDMKRVVWSNDINDFKNATDVSGEETIGEKYMNLYKTSAAVLTSVKKTSGKDTYEIKLADFVTYKNVKKDDKVNSFDKVPTDVSDLLGLKVKVLVRVKNNGDQDVYGVYADDDSKVIATGTLGQLEKVGTISVDKKIKIDGTEYKLEEAQNATPVYYANTGKSATMLSAVESATNDLNKVAGTIKLVDINGNGKADLAMITPAKVGQITYAGSKKVTINAAGIGSQNVEDIDIYDGFAKDDWTVVTDDIYTSSGDIAVAKVDVTSAKVTSGKDNPATEVKVGDAWYKVVTGGADDTNSMEAGNTYDLAIVGNYVVNAKETEGNSNDVLVVTDYESAQNGMKGSSTQKVKAYFLDGSSKTIEVEKLALKADGKESDVSSTNMIGENTVNQIFSYSVRSNGNYTLKLLGANNKAGYESISAGTPASGATYDLNSKSATLDKDNKIDSKLISDDAVVINLYGGSNGNAANDGVYSDVKVTTGKTINDLKIAAAGKSATVAYATKKSNGVETIRVLVIAASDNKKLSGAGSDYKYAYLTQDSYVSKDGEDNDSTTVYEVWNGSENVTLKFDGNDGKELKKGDVLVYSNDGDKFINVENDNVSIFKSAVTGIETKSEGHVVFKGFYVDEDTDTNVIKNATYKADKDCVFIAVNDDDHVGLAGGSVSGVSKAEKDTTPDVHFANAFVVTEKDDEVVLAVIYDADSNRLVDSNDHNIKIDSTGAPV